MTPPRWWLTDALGLPAGWHPAARAKALWGAGWLAFCQGGYRDTATLAKALLDLAPHTGHPLDQRNGLTLRGMAEMADSRYRQAVRVRAGLQICRRLEILPAARRPMAVRYLGAEPGHWPHARRRP